MEFSKTRSGKTRYMVFVSLMAAMVLVMGLVPNLGYIRIAVLSITTVHIPVIIGALLLGWKAGASLGFIFGLTSMITATFISPNPIESPVFSPFYTIGEFQGGIGSVLVCFVPRILVGVVAWAVFCGLSRTRLHRSISLAIAGVAASLTNTLLVLGGIILFFAEPYSKANNLTVAGLYKAIGAIVATNGLAEAAFAGIISAAVATALLAVAKSLKK